MVQFEQRLEQQKVTLWDPYYINYGALKRTIKKLKSLVSDQQGQLNFVTFPQEKALTLNEAQEYFSKRLDDEVEKVVLFFLKQQGILASEMLALNMNAEGARDFAPKKRASSAALSTLNTGQVYDRKSFGNLMTFMETHKERTKGSFSFESDEFMSPRIVRVDNSRESSEAKDDQHRSSRAESWFMGTGRDISFKDNRRVVSIMEEGRVNSGESTPDGGDNHGTTSPLTGRMSPLGGSKYNLTEMAINTQNINYLCDAYVNVGRQLMMLIDFLDLNVTGLRKIIKKFEKSLEHSIGRDYLLSRQERTLSQLRVLYRNEGLKVLIASAKRALEELSFARENLMQNDFQSLHGTAAEINPLYRKLITRQKQMEMEQRRTFQQFIIARTDMFLELAQHEEEDEMEEEGRLLEEVEEHMPSYYINLLCTFLYMANFTINSPTCPTYALELGGTLTMNGVVNGMTPFAACISCVWFSIWTNKCFRPPLYLSVLLLCIGNTMYATALYFDAFWMLCVGRLVLGLGGPRGMNRRYIADTVPVARRTAASAAFVASTAAGTAIGPGFAGLWGDRSFVVYGHHVTPETAPGWAMVIAWLFYLFLLIFFYREPTFRHLPKGMKSEDSDNEEDSNMDLSNKPVSAADDMKYVVIHAYGKYQKNQTIAQKAGSYNEKEKLLQRPKKDPCCPKVPLPVLSLLYFYFVQKYITELIVQSMPVIARTAFDWSIEEVGGLLTGLAVLVLPVNLFTGKLSGCVEDRPMLIFFVLAGLIGIISILDFQSYGFAYSATQYLCGCYGVYVVLSAYEGVLMSLLSRIISPELAKGTFNSGLLATEFGTFGRVVADFSISFVGLVGSVDIFINSVFFPCLCLVASVTLFTICLYKYYRV